MNLNEREKYISLFEKYGETLTQTQKQAFHLHYIEDLSLAEISEITATSRSAAQDAIKKAKAKLEKFEQLLEG